MSKWFYYNENGEKIEVTGGQLKGLAKAGMITPDTIVETEEGKTAPARKVKGLTFVKSTPAQPALTPPSVATESYGVAPPPSPSVAPNPFAQSATATATPSVMSAPAVPSVTPHNAVEKDLRDYIEYRGKGATTDALSEFFNAQRASRFEAWKSAAEGGNPAGQVLLGFCRAYDGAAVGALRWYRKAAKQGHAEGQHMLGFCYGHGIGITQDNIKAEKWFRKAAEQGHDNAAYSLSELVKEDGGNVGETNGSWRDTLSDVLDNPLAELIFLTVFVIVGTPLLMIFLFSRPMRTFYEWLLGM